MTHPQLAKPIPRHHGGDQWLSVKQIVEMYPFLASESGDPRRKIYRLKDLGHFPDRDGRAGRQLLWRQSTIEAWLEDGGVE